MRKGVAGILGRLLVHPLGHRGQKIHQPMGARGAPAVGLLGQLRRDDSQQLPPLSVRHGRPQLADAIQLALVESESQIDSLEPRWDPWLVDGPRITIASLLEEQLMLCMPLVNYHPDDRCIEALEYQRQREPREGNNGNRAAQNPFEVLKVLKENDETP